MALALPQSARLQRLSARAPRPVGSRRNQFVGPRSKLRRLAGPTQAYGADLGTRYTASAALLTSDDAAVRSIDTSLHRAGRGRWRDQGGCRR
jgi:hypothetical protein